MKNLTKFLKFLIFKLGYSLNRISSEQYEIKKLKLLKIKKIENINKSLKKFPNSYHLYYEKYKYSLDNFKSECYLNLNDYFLKKKNWIKKNNLDKISCEFLPDYLFIGSVGNLNSLSTLLIANKINLRTKKKLIAILPNKPKINNKTLLKYFKNYVTFLNYSECSESIVKLSKDLELQLGTLLEFDHKAVRIDEAKNLVNQNMNIKNDSLLKLSSEDIKKGQEKMKKINVDKNKWFIVLHIKERGYRENDFINYQDHHRTPKKRNYLDSIKYITSKGGIVFVVGHNTSYSFPPIKNLIDYRKSSIKSDFMDVFLASQAKFCIGNSSGYFCIAKYFSTPVLLVDGPSHTDFFQLDEGDIYLPRLFKSKIDKKEINLVEAFSYPLNSIYTDESFDKLKLEVIENTSEEIFNATKEMMVHCKDDTKFNQISNLQKTFKEKFEDKNKVQNIKCLSRISNSFLEKNVNLI